MAVPRKVSPQCRNDTKSLLGIETSSRIKRDWEIDPGVAMTPNPY